MGFPSYNAPNEPERGNSHPAGDANTLTLDNLTPGENYKVQIRARYYNADRTVHERSGPWTATATQRVKAHPPAAPTGLAASSIEHDSLTLTWNDPQEAGITGYRVLRGSDAGSLSTIEADTASARAEYTDTTVAAETTYFYAVLALSADGDSTQSAVHRHQRHHAGSARRFKRRHAGSESGACPNAAAAAAAASHCHGSAERRAD